MRNKKMTLKDYHQEHKEFIEGLKNHLYLMEE